LAAASPHRHARPVHEAGALSKGDGESAGSQSEDVTIVRVDRGPPLGDFTAARLGAIGMGMATPTTQQKALEINLDPTQYGTFAEIGAGQEVARWFFRVGGAAGTIAETVSAYDKQVSDARYGSCKRYVSRERLRAMLDHEYGRLREK